jgi:hypothetical protein
MCIGTWNSWKFMFQPDKARARSREQNALSLASLFSIISLAGARAHCCMENAFPASRAIAAHTFRKFLSEW